jgi:hypothetical protein
MCEWGGPRRCTLRHWVSPTRSVDVSKMLTADIEVCVVYCQTAVFAREVDALQYNSTLDAHNGSECFSLYQMTNTLPGLT